MQENCVSYIIISLLISSLGWSGQRAGTEIYYSIYFYFNTLFSHSFSILPSLLFSYFYDLLHILWHRHKMNGAEREMKDTSGSWSSNLWYIVCSFPSFYSASDDVFEWECLYHVKGIGVKKKWNKFIVLVVLWISDWRN